MGRNPECYNYRATLISYRSCLKPIDTFRLMYLDDLSYREIGEILGISEVNVGVKLNRVRKALAELMKKEIANDS
jgi:predicted DNA-binding protein YlxM (UPF0122 family)